jgi:preprotein translocase subunit SecE
MAQPEPTKPVNKIRRRKAPETVREKAEKESAKKASPTKTSAVKSAIAKPINKATNFGKKEYTPLKVPDKKGVRVLNKRVRFIPKWLSNSWAELRQVSWPSKREALSKTMAVFIFAIAFALLVQLLDFIFSRVIKEIILR